MQDFKQNSAPKFTKLAYSDSGFYECKVTMENLERTASFELVVTGESLKEVPCCPELNKKTFTLLIS